MARFMEIFIVDSLVEVAYADELEVRVGEKECMGGDPVGVLPVPFGVGAADEFAQVGAPGCEADITGSSKALCWKAQFRTVRAVCGQGVCSVWTGSGRGSGL